MGGVVQDRHHHSRVPAERVRVTECSKSADAVQQREMIQEKASEIKKKALQKECASFKRATKEQKTRNFYLETIWVFSSKARGALI